MWNAFDSWHKRSSTSSITSIFGNKTVGTSPVGVGGGRWPSVSISSGQAPQTRRQLQAPGPGRLLGAGLESAGLAVVDGLLWPHQSGKSKNSYLWADRSYELGAARCCCCQEQMLIFPFASGWADWARLGWALGFLNFDIDTMHTQYSETMPPTSIYLTL